jgi:Secretion system C-terminal sorting domain
MKHATKSFAALMIVLAVGLLTTGCQITSVDQPSVAPADTTITVVLQMQDANLPANNPDPWVLCVQTPTDWSFVSGSYDAFWRLNGTIGGSATGIGTEWQKWADTATANLPPPAGYKWIGIRSDTGYIYGNDTLYVTATVMLKVGHTTGDYFLGYLMTKAAGNLMDSTAFANFWAAKSMDHAITVTPSTAVIERNLGQVPTSYALDQNYPNPFNPSTMIRYAIKEQTFVKLALFDLEGREVATLVEGVKAPGTYEVQFVAAHLSSGVYLYKLAAGTYAETRKLLLLK